MAEKLTQNAPFFVDREVIVLNSNGTWLSDEIEITHEGSRRMFAQSLKHDEKGYFIQIQHETKYILVEDTAYFVSRVDQDSSGEFQISLSDEVIEKLDPSTLHYRPGRLVCSIQREGKKEEAKFLRGAYFDFFQENLKEDETGYFILIAGRRIELAKKN